MQIPTGPGKQAQNQRTEEKKEKDKSGNYRITQVLSKTDKKGYRRTG